MLRKLSTSARSAASVIDGRRAIKAFTSDPVPEDTLAEILRLTQRAPTGWNMSPFACVLVREQADRERIADAMLDSNVRKVKEAPVVAVFGADLEPSKRVPAVQKLEHEFGTPADYIANLPHYVRMFAGEGYVADALRSAISTVMSPIRPVPSSVPTIAYSYKQTGIVAATFMYAAEAHGLTTCPMEGFDEQRLRYLLDMPDRYSIPMVVCLGYPQPDQLERPKKPRLPLSDLFFDGRFGQGIDSILKGRKD